jgi:hypothetical protein
MRRVLLTPGDTDGKFPVLGTAKELPRIAPKLLRQLRRMAAKQSKPYQTLIHELLEKSARKVA